MSIKAITHVWENAPDGATAERLVLLALADYADENGYAWPKVSTLAAKSGVSPRTAQRALRELEEQGFIETRLGGNIDNANVPSTYRITFKVVEMGRQADAPGATSATGGGDTTVTPSRTVSENRQEEPNSLGDPDGSQQLFEAPPSPAKPAASESPVTLEMIESVWTHYVQRFGDTLRIKTLTPARERTIRKALIAVGAESDADAAVNICHAAIDGLQSYRQTHPGSTDISTIFATGPHDRSNLTDKVEFWASQAETTLPQRDGDSPTPHSIPVDLTGVPSVTKGKIQGERRHVLKMLAHPESESAQARGRTAMDWLRERVGHVPMIEDGKLQGWRHA